MKTPPLTLSDELFAAILGAGLLYNAVSRNDVVRWADQEISERQEVPFWLIELSMSHDLLEWDIINLLETVAGQLSGAAVCRGIFSVVPEPPPGFSFNQYEALAKHLYQIADALLNGDWQAEPLGQARRFVDDFEWAQDDQSYVIQRFCEFLNDQRDVNVQERLRPLQFLLPSLIAEG